MRTPRRILLLLSVSLPLLAAESLGVKPGLWETTTVVDLSNITLPDSVAASLTAEQRAGMEAMLKQMAANGPRTVTRKSCVTPEELKEGQFRAARAAQDQNCKYDVVSSSATRQEVALACSGQMAATGRMVLSVVDNGNVQGDVQMKVQQSNMNLKFKSHWLGADCAAADTK